MDACDILKPLSIEAIVHVCPESKWNRNQPIETTTC